MSGLIPFANENTGQEQQPTVDDAGRLNVNANLQGIDVQIGAVEIKDATSTTRAVVKSGIGAENGLVTIANGTTSVSGTVTSTETLVDDSAFTPATSKVYPFGAEYDDTGTDSVDEGDIGAPRMSANRNLYSTLRDAAGNERGANVNASFSLLTAQTGELPAGTQNIGDIDVATIAAGDNNIGNVDVLTIAAGDNNIGNVDVASLPAGNLGQQLSAASLSVTPATNVTDATYIGDVKFGEAFGQQAMAGSLSVVPANNITDALYIGDIKFGEGLPANSGVDIGDVTLNNTVVTVSGTVLAFPDAYTPSRVTADALVKSGATYLHTVTINKCTVSGTLNMYNGTDTGGTLIASLDIPANNMPNSLVYDSLFGTGLYFDFADGGFAADITVAYR